MKKITSLICGTVVVLSMILTAFASDVPEALLSNDEAQIFFGEVVSFEPDGEIPYVEVIPTKKIKGDVIVDGSCATWQNAETVGSFEVLPGKQYLFTWFDGNNPTDIFEVTSMNTSTLRLKNAEGDMWDRFEKYLNEGEYEKAELERIKKQNEETASEKKDISLAELIGVAEADAEKVNIHYNGEVHNIDVNEFYKAIDGTVLTDIENVHLVKHDGERVSLPNGMYITVNGFDGFAFISDDCFVDKCGMHFSRLPWGEYSIKFTDRAKIMALFTPEADLPFLETPLAGEIFRWGMLAICVFVIAFVIGYTMKKRKN